MKSHASAEKRPTAGLRGASWNSVRVPPDMKSTVCPLQTADGAQITGYLHALGGERVAAMIMHPRELLATHYLVPDLLDAKCAVWVQGPRTVGNDLRLEHEVALLDVAAGMSFLRSAGFEKIVMLGNSGGAGLFAFYNQQSLLEASQRIRKTPGGRPVKLAEAQLPVADGFIFIAPHPGQGKLLANCIDASLTDESNPLSVDSTLDPFSSKNGYKPYPSITSYSPGFVRRYTQAQHERVKRIDEFAQTSISQRLMARERSKAGSSPDDAWRGALNSIFLVWRTDADLRCFDLTLDPSARRWGTVWGADPISSNVGSIGFGRVCTPESWLSTWSGNLSNATFERCGDSLKQPVLMIYYTGDNTVFPTDADAIFASIGSQDKTRHDVRGNHHGHPLGEGEPIGQEVAGRLVAKWLDSRFAMQK
jgi:hypothetical protein